MAVESAPMVLRSVVDLARGFGGRVVAEGIEDPADLRAVEALGIDLVQGFLLSPPLEAASIPSGTRWQALAGLPHATNLKGVS